MPDEAAFTCPELDALLAMPVKDFEITRDTVGDNSHLADHHHDLSLVTAATPSLGLTAHERAELRRVVVRAMLEGVKLEPGVHYTEGSLRWSGITQQRRSAKWQAPSYADCSSFATWCYWDADRWLDRRRPLGDFLNGAGWAAGYTGTLIQHGQAVTAAQLQVCDLVFYGVGIPYHVALYVGNGRVVSHGREQGPELVLMGGASSFRRYIL